MARGYNSSGQYDTYHNGPASEDTESMTGRAALAHLGLARGETVHIKAMIDDAIVAPGVNRAIKLELLAPDGNRLEHPLSVTMKLDEIIRDGVSGPS